MSFPDSRVRTTERVRAMALLFVGIWVSSFGAFSFMVESSSEEVGCELDSSAPGSYLLPNWWKFDSSTTLDLFSSIWWGVKSAIADIICQLESRICNPEEKMSGGVQGRVDFKLSCLSVPVPAQVKRR